MTEIHANHDSIRDRLFKRIHRTGEEVKNDLPNILRTAIQHESWKHYSDSEGRPFANLVEWMVHPFPVGLGLGQSRHALSYENVLSLCESAPEVRKVLLENAPNGKPGPKKELGSSTILFTRGKSRAGSATVLSVRLAQEKPKFYENYLLGEYGSVTAAATAAGLLRNDANLRRVKSAWRKLTPAQRKEFESWHKAELRKRKN